MQTNYIGISKTENLLLSELLKYKKDVFTIKDINYLLSYKDLQSYKLIENLVRKKIAFRLSKGRYFIDYMYKSTDLFSIASNIVWPSYVSFWIMLNKYGFTEQVPVEIAVVTNKSRKSITLKNARIVFINFPKKRFFGYTHTENFVFANREKALIDSLHIPKYAGGIGEIFKCLYNAWNEIDHKVLINYALRMDNKSLLKRLGFLIEKAELDITKPLLAKLKKNLSKSYSKLDPSFSKKGEYNTKWKLIVNLDNLFEWRQSL
ncbi:MAG: hypothetical protein H8D38_05980 [DPANN group archaeon]|nr:hypothetical protein [DPANN group archaeon]